MTEETATDAPTNDVPGAGPTSPRRRHRIWLEWVVIVVIAVVASFIVRTYVFQTYFIPSGSMEPTLQIGDRIIVDKLAVEFGTIHTGDIVVFKAPPAVSNDCADAVTDLVKRVIGLPGERLSSKGNTIYINGKPLTQTWSHVTYLGNQIGTPQHPFVIVPKGQYFMMGDNHPDSCDSRTWGTVPKKDLIGKVFLRIWPLTRFSFL